MLCDCHAMTNLAVKDLARARQFYEKTLGFDVAYEAPDGVVYAARGSAFFVYPSSFAGTNKATAITFQTDDLSGLVSDLRRRGVKFEEYDMPGLKTEGGIARMDDGSAGAWFTDTEGNIISIMQSARARAFSWPRDEVVSRQGA
jgi:catechol-2,3-dioxygenase